MLLSYNIVKITMYVHIYMYMIYFILWNYYLAFTIKHFVYLIIKI